MISAVFIARPRLAIVIAIVITIAGALAMLRIPVAQLPDIVPPQVTVSATYPGASATVVEAAIAQPIEAQVIGVDKMIYMKSNSGNDGSYGLTVSFDSSSNPDIDVVNVNNRVQTAISQLPAEVQLEGLTVQKRSSAILEFLAFYSDDPKMDPLFITNYVLINVLDSISRTPGVGQANLFSKLNYSMRVWFDTHRLVSLNLTPGDIIAAIQAAERGRTDRAHRCAANRRRPAVPVQSADARAAGHRGAVRQHRHSRQSGWLRAARARRGARRTWRAEHGQRDALERAPGRPDRHLPGTRVQCGGYRPCGRRDAGAGGGAFSARAARADHVRFHNLRQRYAARGAAHSGDRLRTGRGCGVPVPRQPARNDHPDRRRAGQSGGNLRGIAGARLHREHRVVAGAGARRRHRGR